MITTRGRLPIPWLRAKLDSPVVRRRVLTATISGLVCCHFLLAFASIQHKSATFDEVAHITAGYSYWQQNDFRLHPENGNLPQRWMTLPLAVFGADVTFPQLDSESWQRSDLWRLGDEFFHHSGNDVQRMLLTARSSVVLVSVALCLLVFFWSRSIFGNLGGLISLLLCAFSPTVLAHGRLATSDMFATFFFAAAIWCVWELLHRVSIGRVLAGMATVSGLFLCKTSAVLLLPIAAVLALLALIPRQSIRVSLPTGRMRELKSQWSRRGCTLAVTLLIGIAAYASVWAAYGFRYAASTDGEHTYYRFRDMTTVAEHSGYIGKVAKWLADRRVLPEPYLYGVAFVAAHEERPAFLNGEYRTKGWRHFFPYCLAVKTPLAAFGILAIGLVAASPRASRDGPDAGDEASRWNSVYQVLPIVVALLILWSVFLGTQLNIGHRHILPTYPLMFVLAGGAARCLRKQTRIAAAVIVLLLLGFVADSLAG